MPRMKRTNKSGVYTIATERGIIYIFRCKNNWYCKDRSGHLLGIFGTIRDLQKRFSANTVQ
jgi:hypothetical protein